MNSSNPYESPSVAVLDARQPLERDIPEEISRPIKHGWIAACVSATMTLLVTLLALKSSTENSYVDAWNLMDVALIALFALGIYKRSRTAATLMLVYFVLSKILMMMETGMPSGLVLGLVFTIFYFRALTATFRYHAFVKQWRRNPPAPRRSLSEDPLFAAKATDNNAP
jgi:hypothetical protein